MEEIIFVTHNKGKIASAKKFLKDVNFQIFEYELDEPRSDDIMYISKVKVMEAYKLVNKPCISIDCGFFIDELNGFPRAFVNFTLDTIGLTGILKLMEGKENRCCRFKECLSYYDGEEFKQFVGTHEGDLAKSISGNNGKEKWSDLWYIFIPQNSSKTLAEMTEEEKALRNKNDNSNHTMKLFADWYKESYLK
ncbi:MAG: non-canonical purine NTP pyrophosphatase [Clostridia bacterium]|nr:non-canonical purine NTP pyrophosphatase [Clostridia bacterium]